MLTKIRAKNFKSLRGVTLDLGQRNVLVGANMAGKSNIMDFFRFIHDMAFPPPGSMGLVNAFVARGGFGEVLWKGGDEQLIELALSGTTNAHGPEWTWDYEVIIQGEPRYDNFRIARESLRVQQGNLPARDLVENVGQERFFINNPPQRLSSTPDSSRSILEFEILGWAGSFLRSSIGGWRFYELVPSIMRDPNQTAAVKYLREHGENLSQWLLGLQAEYYDDSFARIQQVLRDALPQVTGLFNSPTQQSTVVLRSREKDLKRPVTLSQMSAGELAFIAYLSLIFSPPELTGSLYCVEDLENYMHPGLIDTLLEVLRQSQEQWERKHQAAQIVMTTHSPVVVDKMKLEEIVFVEKKDGATVCSRPGDKPHLRKLLQDEEIGLGDLVYTGALSDVGN